MAKYVMNQIQIHYLYWLNKGPYEYWALKTDSKEIDKLLEYKMVSVDDVTKGLKAVYSITDLGRKVLAMSHPGKVAMDKAKAEAAKK